ncbi:serine/threonine-protein kinase [Polyangium jinanense]|uniref:Protein kinase n=1 Tax=Polyangium jinanense TaxID=2829994 RepID=A0A9X3X4P5_9BACT|nr:serine/threonine-protein kinase [Polyangium jinanense]MDC3954329.1 protein kinase [Polyangium jinanense]MDC3984219.1 protein kinase [Polyangium jinanense]
MRCLACGRRVPVDGCPEHGAKPPDSSTPERVELPAPPFPGYEVTGTLGRGGFGVVYAARRIAGGERVAIKLAHPDMAEAAPRLVREVEVMRAVGPPHVPAFVALEEHASAGTYMVMELVAERTLADHLLARAGPLAAREAIALGLAVLRALEAIHARGYVHRDLKPENILVDAEGKRAVLLDFGLAHAVWPAAPALTAAGAIVGTSEYMAPESCEGHHGEDTRADIYAMGVLLYEMLTGRPPFFGPAPLVREGHASQRPPPPSAVAPPPFARSIPPLVEELVLRCLAKAPADRPPSAAYLRATLAAALALPDEEQLVLAVPMSEPPPGTKPPKSAERRVVCIACFESSLDAIALRRALEPFGAQIVHASAGRCVAAFGHEVDENPARRALEAARALTEQGACERVALDLASVAVHLGPDGSRRILAPRIARDDRFPKPSSPRGVSLSATARAVLEASGVAPDPLPVDLDLGVEETPPTSSGEGTEATPSRISIPLSGRERVLDALTELGRQAIEESLPAVAVVLAEAGCGKSFLKRALLERLGQVLPRTRLIVFSAHEPVHGAAGSVRDLLQRALGLPAEAPEDGGRKLLAATLGPARHAEAGASVALSLGWISKGNGATITGSSTLHAIEAAPGALRTLLTVSVGEALRRRALEEPLCVILDDAHFADDATLAILDLAARAEARAPLFVCVLGRPSFEEDHPSWGARAHRRTVHRLGPLDPASAAALCRELLRPAENVPESAVARIAARAEGVPLLLVELVRGLKAQGIVRKHPSGSGYFLATDELDDLPDLPLIEWLAHRELDALPPAARAHACLAAVLGAEVTVAEMQGVLGRLDRMSAGGDFPLDARVGSERLVAAGLLARHGPGRYAFRHALVREAIARSVPEAQRARIHLAATAHLQQASGWDGRSPPRGDERHLAQLAHHATNAGERALGERAYLALADAARARHDWLDAERCYTRALEASAASAGAPDKPLDLRQRALRGRGLMRYRLGRYPDALDDLALACDAAAGDHLAEAEILLDQATVLDWMADYEASRARVVSVLAILPESPPPALLARLLLGQGLSLLRFSREHEAVPLLERVIEVADAIGDEAYEPRIVALFMLGFVLPALGRLVDAERAIERAVELCESHGDDLHLASVINARAFLAALVGDKARMVADFERVAWLGRELGQDWLEIAAHHNLGEYLYLWDDLDAAEPHAARALALEVRHTGGAPRPVIALLDGRLRYFRGDLEGAREAAARIREQAGPTLPVPAEDVLCVMLELATSDADDAAWDALEARSREFSVGQERLEVTEARGLSALRRGRAADARRHFERALEIGRTLPNVMTPRIERLLARTRADEVTLRS